MDLILLLVAFAVNLVCLLACCLLRSLRARVVVEEQIDIICPASGQARTAHAKNAKNASNGQRCTKQVIAVLSLTRPATASFLTASIHNVQSFRSLSKRIRTIVLYLRSWICHLISIVRITSSRCFSCLALAELILDISSPTAFDSATNSDEPRLLTYSVGISLSSIDTFPEIAAPHPTDPSDPKPCQPLSARCSLLLGLLHILNPKLPIIDRV